MTEGDYEREESMLALARGIARLGKEERAIVFAWLDVADEIALSDKPYRKVPIRAVALKTGFCNHKADELFRSAKVNLKITITEQLKDWVTRRARILALQSVTRHAYLKRAGTPT